MKSFRKPNSLIAFQWSSEELQYVIARPQGGGYEIVAADSVCLSDGTSQEQLAKHLQEVLRQHGIRRAMASVVLGRAHVDMLPLELPQATDNELPALVEFQVGQQLTDLATDATIDYIPLMGDGEQGRKVLACVLRRTTAEFIESICRETHLQLRRIGVRPLCAAAHLPHLPAGSSPVVVISPHGTEADLTVHCGGKLAIARTIRLPGNGPQAQAIALAAEVRRSLVSLVLGAEPDAEPDGLECHLFGSTEEPPPIHSFLDDALQTTVQMSDPFASLPHDPPSLGASWPPEGSGSYAPLLGILLADAIQENQIDFLHPHRVPVPPNPRQRYIKYATAAILLVAVGGWFIRQAGLAQQQEVLDLTRQFEGVESRVAKLGTKREVVAAIEQWQRDDITWLDELHDFTRRFPSAEQAYLQRLSINTDGRDLGIIELQIRVQDPAHLEAFESKLRDNYHSINSKRVTEQDRSGGFGWQFESTIAVRARPREEYGSPLMESLESAAP